MTLLEFFRYRDSLGYKVYTENENVLKEKFEWSNIEEVWKYPIKIASSASGSQMDHTTISFEWITEDLWTQET